jgi:hypothetical protein
MTGAEPAPGPTRVSSEEWIWAADMEEPWSEESEITLTEDETRLVNLMTVCFRSARLGTKPTMHGNQVALSE